MGGALKQMETNGATTVEKKKSGSERNSQWEVEPRRGNEKRAKKAPEVKARIVCQKSIKQEPKGSLQEGALPKEKSGRPLLAKKGDCRGGG